jgi:chemotaxis protein CheD
VIATLGLGSCVAIVLHDARSGVGGLAHVLLPDASMSRDRGNRAKFAATAVALLVEEMRDAGSRGPIAAKLVGGASMFAQLLPSSGTNMGERNAEAARAALGAAGIPLVAHDTGGEHGRSVYFHVRDGRVAVRSIRKGDIVI